MKRMIKKIKINKIKVQMLKDLKMHTSQVTLSTLTLHLDQWML